MSQEYDIAWTQCAAAEIRLRFLLASQRYLEQPTEKPDDQSN